MSTKIEWNRVTWYSKLIAVILFVATFYIAFMFGKQAQRIDDQQVVSTQQNIQ